MVPLANAVAFIVVAIPIILIPGPGVLFIIGRSLSLGRLGGVLSVLGTSIGTLIVVVAVAFGVGILIAQSIVLFTAIKIAGAAYLIYLGVQAIRHRREKADAATIVVPPTPAWKLLLQGALVGVTNPKTIVFFIAVLPQFVHYDSGNIPVQLLLLGALFVAVATVSDAAWALLAGSARSWFGGSPRRMSTLGAAGGVMMIGLGTASLFVGHGKH